MISLESKHIKKSQGNYMEMIPVRSTAISAVGYDKETKRMSIKFKQGHTYDYCRVPESIFLGLISASSKGRYYDSFIKDNYDC
jgi:hypothetical protein